MSDWPNVCLTDWMSDWLNVCLTDWMSDWLTECLTDWMSDWLTDWMSDCLTDWTSNKTIGENPKPWTSFHFYVERQSLFQPVPDHSRFVENYLTLYKVIAINSNSRPSARIASSSWRWCIVSDWLTECLTDWMSVWLIECPTDWLNVWLTECLTD